MQIKTKKEFVAKLEAIGSQKIENDGLPSCDIYFEKTPAFETGLMLIKYNWLSKLETEFYTNLCVKTLRELMRFT